MPICQISRAAIHFQQVGAGPDVVLLHHAIGSVCSWRKQLPVLAGQFRATAYDRPGFGQSTGLDAWPTDYLDQDVADLIALLDALGIARAALVGHSDGATIALLAAARHPQRVTKVLAESPHVAVEVLRCPQAIELFVADLAASPDLQASLARNHGPRAGQVVQRWRDRWCDPAFWTWDVSDELAAVRCPVLVVHGAADPYFSVQHSAMIAQRTQGELAVLTGLGHSPHSEAPELFAPLLLGFLQKSLSVHRTNAIPALSDLRTLRHSGTLTL
jgi:pimeloyl-ACP methyl ester carboxylesterase